MTPTPKPEKCGTCGSGSVWFTKMQPVKSYPPHGNGCPDKFHLTPEQIAKHATGAALDENRADPFVWMEPPMMVCTRCGCYVHEDYSNNHLDVCLP